jgi:hypothetical protein
VVLLFALGGSAFAGMPMHSNEMSCPMGGAMSGDMDCCKTALMHSQTLQVTSARLCCALNCSQDGTLPSNAASVSPPMQIPLPAFLVSPQPVTPSVFLLKPSDNTHGPPASDPVYIRNLSLLI